MEAAVIHGWCGMFLYRIVNPCDVLCFIGVITECCIKLLCVLTGCCTGVIVCCNWVLIWSYCVFCIGAASFIGGFTIIFIGELTVCNLGELAVSYVTLYCWRVTSVLC